MYNRLHQKNIEDAIVQKMQKLNLGGDGDDVGEEVDVEDEEDDVIMVVPDGKKRKRGDK